jgi:hypothetical protein
MKKMIAAVFAVAFLFATVVTAQQPGQPGPPPGGPGADNVPNHPHPPNPDPLAHSDVSARHDHEPRAPAQSHRRTESVHAQLRFKKRR